jgi:MATE family multidrug resistance protein
MGGSRSRGSSAHDARPLSSSFKSGSPLAERYLAQDIAACSDDEEGSDDVANDGPSEHPEGPHFRFRRPSGVAYGGTRPVLGPQSGDVDEAGLSPLERKQSRNAERSLLRDNHILPPKHQAVGKPRPDNFAARAYRWIFSTKIRRADEEGPGIVVQPPDERAPLLGGAAAATGPVPEQPSSPVSDDDLDEQWIQAVAEGRIRTTWQREAKTLAEYSGPLVATFFLQYSINVASIFAVGRIGKLELGAVSLANMSAAITCLAPFQGLATSLDTLCAQAYGSGHKKLVGLQFQRMTYFLFILSVPVVIIWIFSEEILRKIVPEPESARLASLYLKVMIFSIPGFILFECGKRFTQAQGLFRATTYVLILAAPFNIFINWLLVWKLELGFIGAPIAVAITDNLLPILLFLYVRFIDGRQCWGGFTKRAFTNWWVMIRLALPGMVMVEAEWLAFELMTLLSSRFGSEYLAAQSVLVTLATISYQIPFPVSIAASTRIANLIGAGLVDAAKVAAKVAFFMGCFIGVFNLTMYSSLRFYLPLLFTQDEEVISIVAHTLPIVAVTQVFDGLCAGAHGLLRGIGKQSIGGPANLFAYYVISLPISLGLAFGLSMKLDGLWLGVTVGLISAALIEYTYLLWVNWETAAVEAQSRNEAG